MSNIRVISNYTQFKGMVEMLAMPIFSKLGAVGDLRRAVHADDDPVIFPIEEWAEPDGPQICSGELCSVQGKCEEKVVATTALSVYKTLCIQSDSVMATLFYLSSRRKIRVCF